MDKQKMSYRHPLYQSRKGNIALIKLAARLAPFYVYHPCGQINS